MKENRRTRYKTQGYGRDFSDGWNKDLERRQAGKKSEKLDTKH